MKCLFYGNLTSDPVKLKAVSLHDSVCVFGYQVSPELNTWDVIRNLKQRTACVLTHRECFCHWVPDSMLIFVTSSIVCSITCWMNCWCLNPVRMFGVIPSHEKDYPRTQSGKWLGCLHRHRFASIKQMQVIQFR